MPGDNSRETMLKLKIAYVLGNLMLKWIKYFKSSRLFLLWRKTFTILLLISFTFILFLKNKQKAQSIFFFNDLLEMSNTARLYYSNTLIYWTQNGHNFLKCISLSVEMETNGYNPLERDLGHVNLISNKARVF